MAKNPPVKNLLQSGLSLSATEKGNATNNLAGALNPGLTNWFRGGVSGKKVVFWGDSTTSNATVMFGSASQPTVSGGRLAAFHQQAGEVLEGATLLNYGNNGSSLATALANGVTYGVNAVIAANPQLVVLCFGINDVRLGATDLATMTARLTSAVTQLRSTLPACDIVLWIPNSLLSTDPGSTGLVTSTGIFNGMTLAQAAQAATDLLWNAYKALENTWPNVVVVDKQAVFGRKALPTSTYMGDILHPAGPGQIAEADQIAAIIGQRGTSFSSLAAVMARIQAPATPWTVYAREIEDPTQYDLIATGEWVGQGGGPAGGNTNGFLDFSWPGTRAGELWRGDLVVMGFGGSVFQLPIGATIAATGNNTRLSNLGVTLPPVAMTGGTVNVFRAKYGPDSLGNVPVYWANKIGYPSRRKFYVQNGGTNFIDLNSYPGEAQASASTFTNTDTLIVAGRAVVVMSGSGTASASGNQLRLTGLGTGIDYSADIGKQAFLFSTTAGRF